VSLYVASVPVALQALRQANGLLDKVELRPELLEARLASHMFNCAGQVRMAADFALRSTFPLAGLEPQRGEFGARLAGLRERLADAATQINGLTPQDFAGSETRIISHRAGFVDHNQTGPDYLYHFALPNLWFHLSMAYASLRMAGLPIGKADFDGLHAYPDGFSF
jgi:uncharacterized protein